MRPLDVTADQFEAFAHRVVAATAEYLATLDDRATVQPTSAASTSAAFDLPVSEEGVGESVIDDLTAMTAHVRANTGRRLPYVVGSGEPIAGPRGPLCVGAEPERHGLALGTGRCIR